MKLAGSTVVGEYKCTTFGIKLIQDGDHSQLNVKNTNGYSSVSSLDL